MGRGVIGKSPRKRAAGGVDDVSIMKKASSGLRVQERILPGSASRIESPNRALTPSPSPIRWERVAAGRVRARFIETRGAWGLCLGLFVLCLGWPSGAALAAPLADQFGTATPIEGLVTVTGSNVGATAQVGEPAHYAEPASRSVWARWTATRTGTYHITTTNSTFDTVLAIYLGTTLNKLKVICTNDDIDFRTLQSHLFFRAYEGETFQIAVDGVGGATGQVELSVFYGGPAMPGWQTTDPLGNPVGSDAFSNQVMLVDFWETTCGTCVDELPDLVRLYQSLAPRGFSMVGLSIDPTTAPVVDWLSEHAVPYPMWMSSPEAKLSLLGGDFGVPTKYLVDRERRIVARFLGGHDPLQATYPFYESVIRPLVRASSLVQLQMERTGGVVNVSWLDPGTNPRLESSSLPSGPWGNAFGSVSSNSAGRITVSMPIVGPDSYFRLTTP